MLRCRRADGRFSRCRSGSRISDIGSPQAGISPDTLYEEALEASRNLQEFARRAGINIGHHRESPLRGYSYHGDYLAIKHWLEQYLKAVKALEKMEPAHRHKPAKRGWR